MTDRALTIGLLVGFGLTLFVALVLVTMANDADIVRYQRKLIWLKQIIGVFVATAAVLALLLEAALLLVSAERDARSDRWFFLILPLVAGLLLVEVHWATALVLVVLAAGHATKEALGALARNRET